MKDGLSTILNPLLQPDLMTLFCCRPNLALKNSAKLNFLETEDGGNVLELETLLDGWLCTSQ